MVLREIITLKSHNGVTQSKGDDNKQYSLLVDYNAKLQKVRARNTCKIQLHRFTQNLQLRFRSYYICLDECKISFSSGTRPFIGVDPNDQYFHLHLNLLRLNPRKLGDYCDIKTNKWVFISNQQKSPDLRLLHKHHRLNKRYYMERHRPKSTQLVEDIIGSQTIIEYREKSQQTHGPVSSSFSLLHLPFPIFINPLEKVTIWKIYANERSFE
ncbi:hypothetical protein CR513_55433, partial [Mucuna pruriens]